MDEALREKAIQIARNFKEAGEMVYQAPYPELAARQLMEQRADVRADRIRELIRSRNMPKVVWAVLNRLAQHMLREREPLPGELADWMAERLAGNLEQPAKGDDRHANRDMIVVETVDQLVRFYKIRPLQNKEVSRKTDNRPTSACDVVAEVWGLTYDTVAKIWQKHDRQLMSRLSETHPPWSALDIRKFTD